MKLWNPFVGLRRGTTTGSNASALTAPQVPSPGLAQGSGSLNAGGKESIGYGAVPLQYVHSPVPRKANVGKPIHQHTNFVTPTSQRAHPQIRPVVPHGSRAPLTGKHGGR